MLEEKLITLGFSKREAHVYLALLELGTAGAQDIARLSGEKRTTVYEICKPLIAKNIIIESQKNTKKVFTAADPSTLAINILSQQSTLETIMPTLKAMMHTESSKPNFRYFDTITSIQRAYEDLIESNPQEILTMVSPQNLSHTLGEKWLKAFIARRMAAGIPVRALSLDDTQSDNANYWKKRDKEDARKTKYIAMADIPPIDVLIYGNKVLFIALGTEKMAFSIESNIISNYMRALFDTVWKVLPSNI